MADDIDLQHEISTSGIMYIVALCASELVLFLHTVRTALTLFLGTLEDPDP